MRLIFLGSGEFGLPTLERLAAAHQVLAVVTQPDRPAGRHRHLTATPVGQWAAAAGLPLHKCDDVNAGDFVSHLGGLGAQAAVVIAFGQKLSPPLLRALGPLQINLHASLLPKYRGAAPINWAILRGEMETGLSVISLAQKMDAGLIYAQQSTPIGDTETAGELHDRLARLGPDLVLEVLDRHARGELQGLPQEEAQATRAPKLGRPDAVVDLSYDCFWVARRIHGLTPWPGVSVRWQPRGQAQATPPGALKLLRVKAEPDLSCFIGTKGLPAPGLVLEGHRVAVRDGAIRLLEVQAPGGKPMPIEQFVRGHALKPGDFLSGDRLSADPAPQPGLDDKM